MTLMPKYKQPAAGFSNEYHRNLEADLLRQRSRAGLSSLLSIINVADTESIYKARLEAELRILEECNCCGYFLIVADYVNWAKDNGIAVGPGRGAGPCSLVGFALGITKVDPIHYDLPFERFVNPDKESLPDFDLEFCGKRYVEVTSYLQSKYGKDRVAQISSKELSPLPSRIIICDRPLAELAPLYLNSLSGYPAIKMTIEQVKNAGLVQFNVIDRKALTDIQRTVNNLEKSGTAIDIDSIALNDSGAFQQLSEGIASDTDLLDSEYFKTALTSIKPQRFEELCAVAALCHPSLRGSTSLYMEGRRNPDSIHYYHCALESITAETYGVLIYQEQLMHITNKIAGFTMAQGDLFRRAIKKSNREALTKYKNMFVAGAEDFGLTKDEATGLFEHLIITGRNTFNKSHAVAFAVVAYQTAWLKANYENAVC